jgi:hypothetical protein
MRNHVLNKTYNFNTSLIHILVQENQVRRKLNGTHQLVAYVADINLLGNNINTATEHTAAQATLVRRTIWT